MVWCNFPMVVCPQCLKQSQIDDYYDFESGDSFYCPKCETELFIWATDRILSADIHTKPEKEAS